MYLVFVFLQPLLEPRARRGLVLELEKLARRLLNLCAQAPVLGAKHIGLSSLFRILRCETHKRDGVWCFRQQLVHGEEGRLGKLAALGQAVDLGLVRLKQLLCRSHLFFIGHIFEILIKTMG